MGKNDNYDDFWDLSDLIPKNKQQKKQPKNNDVSAVEIIIPSKPTKVSSPAKDDNFLPFASVKKSEKKEKKRFIEYHNPTPLIKSVRVEEWKHDYDYYSFFCSSAKMIRKIEPKECSHVSFFSYMPQYSQMNRMQTQWYVWWRDRVFNNVYLDTDYPYILLLIYEIINLSSKETAENDLETLIRLWYHYRNVYPQLNKNLGEWICDFSMFYNLKISFPHKYITGEMIESVSIPEVFYSFDFSDVSLLSKFLLSFCNSYNYRKSKAYDEASAIHFDKHIPKAFELVLSRNNNSERIFNNSTRQAHRIAFMGMLCVPKMKSTIIVYYVSLALENNLKNEISDIIRYIENKLRTALGIRSKLKVTSISNATKAMIDNYFDGISCNRADSLIVPEYEKLYDSTESFSLDTAKDIESSSWEVTKLLVEAFEDQDVNCEDAVIVEPQPSDEPQSAEESEEGDSLSVFYSRIGRYAVLFKHIVNEEFKEQLSFARSNSIMIEAAVDEINEAASEIFGDIVIEEADVGFKVIDDYKEMFNIEV